MTSLQPAVSYPPAPDTIGNDPDQAAWHNVREALRAELGDDVFLNFIDKIELQGIDDDAVRLSAPTAFVQRFVARSYRERIFACWRAERPGVRSIEVVHRSIVRATRVTGADLDRPLSAEPAAPAAPPAMPVPTALHDAIGGSALDPRFSFASIVVGSSNRIAHAAALQICDPEATVMFNPLYVSGPVGVGKTHLLQATAARGLLGGGQRKFLYLTAERFMYGFAQGMRMQGGVAFKEALRGIDVLLVDDLQFLTGRATQAEFGHTLNALLDAGRQVVLAADRPPADLEGLDDRIRSRLAAGLVAEVGAPAVGLRREILERRMQVLRAQHPGFDLPADVLDYVAQIITQSGRDLEGALNRLVAHSRLAGVVIGLEMAEQCIRDLVRTADPRRVKIEDIQRVVGRHYNVSRADLLSARRTANVVRPRQIAMFLTKALTLRSLPEIGRRFGGRDHTTVLHAVRKIENLAGIDGALKEELELLKRQLVE